MKNEYSKQEAVGSDKGDYRQDEVKIISFIRPFVANNAPVQFDNMLDKGKPMPGAVDSLNIITPDPFLENLLGLFLCQVRACTEYIELYAPLPAFWKVFNYFPAIGYCLAFFAKAGGNLSGVFCRIRKEVGIDLGQQPDVHKELELLIQHIARSLHHDIG